MKYSHTYLAVRLDWLSVKEGIYPIIAFSLLLQLLALLLPVFVIFSSATESRKQA